MSLAIVSNWRDSRTGNEWNELAAVTIPNRRDYAARHGYATRYHHFPGHFGKLSALLESWEAADWLWWLDLDAIITNPAMTLHDLTADGDVICACDRNGLNSGSMLFRTVPEVRRVLEEIWNRRQSYDNGPWHDQNGFAYQLWGIRDRVRIVEKRRLNAYPEDWQPGDFVLHCPGMPNDQRREILRCHLIRLAASNVSESASR